MAFYTSRVDRDGKEIERRQSARSLSTIPSSSTTSTNPSLHLNSTRSCESKSSSVRFINSAAYVEKRNEPSDDTSSQTDEHKNYDENESDIVPPLDIQSEENYPTTRDYTFSYRKHCEAAKIVLKPDLAYETWLSAKRKILSDEASRRKKAEDQKRKEQEERKRLADEKFQQWLQTKSRCKPNIRSCTTIKSSESRSIQIRNSRTSQLSEEEAQAKLEEWQRTKQLEEERRRMLKRREAEQQREMEEQRRRQAADAWEKWLAEAGNKPKPVPLNRGFFTLKGTVSDIFVNPNEWKTIGPTTVGNDDE